MIPTRCSGKLVLCALFLAAPWLTACSEEPPSSTEVGSIQPAAGKGGVKGGGGKGGDEVTVDATDPPETVLASRLDVRVLGSGYDNGSKATFILGSTGATLISHSTLFVSESELLVDLEAPADADGGLYDVEVLTARGRKGIGIERFEVIDPTIKAKLIFSFQDGESDNIKSDGRASSAGPRSYADGECGVFAHLRINPPYSTDGNARVGTGWTKLTPAVAETCPDGSRDHRKIRVDFTHLAAFSAPANHDGQTLDAYFMNITDVELVPVGSTVLRPAVLYFVDDECVGPGGLKFHPGVDPQSNFVEVTKNADGTWTIETQPYPNDVAFCVPKRKNAQLSYYHMPFQVTVSVKP